MDKEIYVSSQEPRASNAIGIASLIVGALSLTICWIPLLNFFSFILGAFGILLAIIGFVICMNRSFKGIAYPIGGGAVSVLSIVGAIALYVAVAGAAAKNLERAQQPRATPSASPSSGGAQAQPVALPGPNEWVPLDGPLKVRVIKAALGHIQVKDMNEAKQSKDVMLLFSLEVSNTSDGKKADYISFSSPALSMRSTARLSDDLDNSYSQTNFGFTSSIVGMSLDNSVYPGKTTSDVVAFEPPVEKAKWVQLSLKTLSGEGTASIRIPIEFISKTP